MKKLIMLAVLLFPVSAFAWTLDWADNSANEDGMRVYRKLPSESVFMMVSELPVNSTHYVDVGQQTIGTCYKIAAFNAVGEAFSGVTCANTPSGNPGNPKISK